MIELIIYGIKDSRVQESLKAIEQRRTVNFVSCEKTVTPLEIKIDGHIFMCLVDTGAEVPLFS